MLNDLKLAIVDVETTGGSAAYNRIIEVGIQRIEAGQVVGSYSSLVDPGCRIPPEIQQLTGITDRDVADAPTFSQIHRDVRALLDGCVFVAHNARFDYAFIRHECERAGQPFSATCLCTVRLSRLLYPEHQHHSLNSLMERYGLSCARRHRALDDAEVVWAFLRHVREHVDEQRLSDAIATLLRRPTLPPFLTPDAIEDLPDGPGVYIFYDPSGMPLYVGKSVDIRGRVLSHFSSDHTSGRQMRICQQTARIETRSTYGELGALLLESQLIKKLSPLHNRMSRITRKLVALYLGDPIDGYDTVRIEQLNGPSLREHGEVLAIFRSRRQAKEFLYESARAQRLCPKLLGLERTDGACFYTQLGECAGACEGRENPVHYNARLAGIFATRRIRTWPYPGPVLIEERHPDRHEGHAFVLDQWRLVRAVTFTEDGSTSTFLDAEQCFDFDSYHILSRHLLRRRDVRRLTPREAQAFLGQDDLVAVD